MKDSTKSLRRELGEGLDESHFGPETGTKPYEEAGGQDLSSALRKTVYEFVYLGFHFLYDPSEVRPLSTENRKETFLCGICNRVIFTYPVHLHDRAPRQAVKGARVCVVCQSPFHPTRSDHVYCSDACRKKGSRLGPEKIEDHMENDAFMRRCQAPDCEETLIGRTARAEYCSTACRVRAAYHKGGPDSPISGVSQA